MKQIFDIDPWHVKTSDFDPNLRRQQEAMTSTGNGYMGMRGMFEEDYTGNSLPGIYIGGVWFPDKTRVGWWKNGYPKYFGKVINAVNFIQTHILINGKTLDLATADISNFQLDLDMHQGLLSRSFIYHQGDLQLAFKFQRFLSVVRKELSVQNIEIHNLSNETVSLEMMSNLDADVKNEDANYGEHFWEIQQKSATSNQGFIQVKTIKNPFETPRFALGILMDNRPGSLENHASTEGPLDVSDQFVGELTPAADVHFEKRVIVTTSRDYDEAQLQDAARKLMQPIQSLSFDQLLTEQTNAWQKRWDKSDIQITGNDAAQQGIRFNLFQLFSTYYGEDSRLNIGPKGFTGEKYGGATYWDTEAFVLPVYLGITDPDVSKNLLLYRYHQLKGAFHNAEEQGLAGALFPMVTFNGIENHNEWEITFEEIHRNGSIAYAIYNYTRYTGDESYVLNQGVDILVALSRFWASRVHYSKRRGKYVIHGVTGPDEYENNVNNNWYTNLLAQWTLKYTLQELARTTAQKQADLAVSASEKEQWQAIIDQMYLGVDTKTGVFIQNDDYFDKDLKLASEIPADQRPINQHWSWDKILRSPYIKQADVLQGIWYFIDDFDMATKRRNFDFYESFTVHESSLSPSVHAILAADLHDEDKAVAMYQRTARLDLDDYNNEVADGLHVTSMAGSWLAIVQGFAGMRVRHGQLHFAPFLPKAWQGYQFRILFRGRLIQVKVQADGSQLSLISGAPITVDLAGKSIELK